jgi:hypothetical protein
VEAEQHQFPKNLSDDSYSSENMPRAEVASPERAGDPAKVHEPSRVVVAGRDVVLAIIAKFFANGDSHKDRLRNIRPSFGHSGLTASNLACDQIGVAISKYRQKSVGELQVPWRAELRFKYEWRADHDADGLCTRGGHVQLIRAVKEIPCLAVRRRGWRWP